MRKLLMLSMVLMAQAAAWAQTFTEWHDMDVNGVNRMQNHTSFPVATWRLAVQVGGECFPAAH